MIYLLHNLNFLSDGKRFFSSSQFIVPSDVGELQTESRREWQNVEGEKVKMKITFSRRKSHQKPVETFHAEWLDDAVEVFRAFDFSPCHFDNWFESGKMEFYKR